MEYYTELKWMLPITVVTFTVGVLLLVVLFKKNVFQRWMKPKK